MITYIIVDDEPLAHDLIENFAKDLPHLKLLQNCYNAMEALQFLNGQSADIIFLDLNMPKLKGFDFLRTLDQAPKIIVTTAYKEFALEGYELNVVDYLLKPFSFDRFIKAVNKATKEATPPPIKSPVISTPEKSNRFFIKGDKQQYQINTADILYIEAYGNYIKLFLKEEMLVCHEKISTLENRLPANNFLRIHKSFIIALDKIKAIEGNRIIITDNKIPIGQTYRKQVTMLLK